MLKKYKSIIYKSEDDEKRAFEECISCVQKYHPDCTRAEIYDCVENNKVDILSYDFFNELLMIEGAMLFDVVISKYGEKLWSNSALPNNNCEKICPVGEICDKAVVEINKKSFCYGQLYQKRINMKSLQEISQINRVQIIEKNGKVLVDLNTSDYDEELLSEFLFRYERFISRYGDYGEQGIRKVNGCNVIAHL